MSKKKVVFHCDMRNDEIVAILDSVHWDNENAMNDSDTEYLCVSQDGDDVCPVNQAVVHPLGNHGEKTDFLV